MIIIEWSDVGWHISHIQTTQLKEKQWYSQFCCFRRERRLFTKQQYLMPKRKMIHASVGSSDSLGKNSMCEPPDFHKRE